MSLILLLLVLIKVYLTTYYICLISILNTGLLFYIIYKLLIFYI
jgi:hypothetical protein